MNRSKWIDRGWWLSVDINKNSSSRKYQGHALGLLEMAHEHYDLQMESGKTIVRGIFTAKSNLENIAKLLETVNRWTDRTVFIKGRKLSGSDMALAINCLICAASCPPCQIGPAGQQMNYLGCHLMKIGLMNYSLAALKNGAPAPPASSWSSPSGGPTVGWYANCGPLPATMTETASTKCSSNRSSTIIWTAAGT